MIYESPFYYLGLALTIFSVAVTCTVSLYSLVVAVFATYRWAKRGFLAERAELALAENAGKATEGARR